LHRARRWVELLQIAGEHPPHMEIDAFLQREAEEHRLAFEKPSSALREPFAQTLRSGNPRCAQAGSC
jgi:hypothetical protein